VGQIPRSARRHAEFGPGVRSRFQEPRPTARVSPDSPRPPRRLARVGSTREFEPLVAAGAGARGCRRDRGATCGSRPGPAFGAPARRRRRARVGSPARLGAGGWSLAGARPTARFEPVVEGARTSARLHGSCPFGPTRTWSHTRHAQGLCVVSTIARNSLIIWDTERRRGRRRQRGGAVSYARYRTLQTPEIQPSSHGREHQREIEGRVRSSSVLAFRAPARRSRGGAEVPRVRSRADYDGGARRGARLGKVVHPRPRCAYPEVAKV
jgi:hypothetical protein